MKPVTGLTDTTKPRAAQVGRRGASPFDITGRTALVTGSSRGIGFALARTLLESGARVVIHGRNEVVVRSSAEQLASETGGVTRVAMFDVTDAEAVDEGVSDLESDWGTPDILVNNAGLQRRAPLTEFPIADWYELVATNLTSAFLMSRRLAQGMVTRGSGKIINIGSVQSQLARPSIAAYSATKGGIVMLTKGLCADLAPFGSRRMPSLRATLPPNSPRHWWTTTSSARGCRPGHRRADGVRGGPCRRAPVPRLRHFDIRQRPDPICRRRDDRCHLATP